MYMTMDRVGPEAFLFFVAVVLLEAYFVVGGPAGQQGSRIQHCMLRCWGPGRAGGSMRWAPSLGGCGSLPSLLHCLTASPSPGCPVQVNLFLAVVGRAPWAPDLLLQRRCPDGKATWCMPGLETEAQWLRMRPC